VFPAWDGAVDRHEEVPARFKAGLATAGLKPIRFHEMRHTFGTLAAQKLPLTTVQALMGHYVAHPDEAAKIGEAFRGAAPQVPSWAPVTNAA
jgi:integrase